MKNYLLVNRALAAEKKINLIEMLQGCSKRNGTTFRQSNPDGQTTVKRQSRLMLRQGYLRNLAMIFAVLVLSIGQMWGAPTQSYVLTGSSSTIANGKTANIGGAYCGRKGSGITLNKTYGLPSGGGNSAAVFVVNQTSNITFILDNQQTSAKSGSVLLASVSDSYYTDCQNGTLGNLPSTASQTKAVSFAKNANSGENEFTFESSVSAGKYVVYWTSGINASIYLKRIEINATGGGSCINVGISTQPTSPVAATVGSACSITGLVASGTSPSYQWYTCNSDGSSATAINAAGSLSFTGYQTATLGLTPTAAGTTYYKCVVSGSCGDPVTSNVVAVNATAQYTVTYNLNGGKYNGSSDAPTQSAVTSGTNITMPVLAPTKADYAFVGWRCSVNSADYMPSASYTMTAANTTFTAQWTEACFEVPDARKNSNPAATITASMLKGNKIAGGTLTWESASDYSGNGDHGLILNEDGEQIVVTLSEGTFVAGSIITITTHGNSGTSKTCGVKVSGNNMTPATYSTESTGYRPFSQTYVVQAGDGIVGTNTFAIKRYNSNQVYIYSITVSGCGAPSCTAPTSPSITPSNGWLYVPGEEITLTASASNTDASTTYTWYRGATLEAAKAAGAIQAAKTSAQGGTTYTIASCTASDAYKYWCEISNGTGCEASASYDIKLYTFFLYNNDHSNNNSYAFTSIDRTNKKLSVTFDVSNATYTYYFKVSDGLGTWYGKNSYTITSATNYCDGLNSSGANVGLTTTLVGSYTVDYYYQSNNVVVTYPVPNQTAGQTVYFDNTLTQMSNMYIRIGSTTHSSASSAFTAVPGTAALYQGSTIAWDGFAAWSIADNTGWTNTNSIYQPWNGQWTSTGNDYQMSKQTDYQNYVVSGAVTIVPTALHNSEYNCQYYNVDKYNGLLTHNVSITPPSYGTLTINYTTISNEPAAFNSGNRDLAHTANYCVTAEEGDGYTVASITINGTPVENRSWHVLREDVVVAATFSPASYTVTLNTNGGTINAGNVTSYTYGTGATLPTNVTKDGFTFGGWYDNSGLTGSAVTTISTTATGNKEYWAKWTAAASLTALECNTLYKVADMVPASITLSGTEQYAAGLSSNARFEVIGDPAQTDGEAGTPGMKNEAAEFAEQSFTARMYLKGASNTTGSGTTFVPTSRAVKFIVGEAGTLDIYAHRVDRLYLKKAGDSGTTQLGTSTSGSGSKVSHSVTAGTYYIYATNNSTCIYGIQLNCCSTPAAPTAFSAGSITSTGATFSITDAGDAASYDIYYSTSSTAPTASTAATTTSTSKTKAVTGLTASTTYYAWVRSVCDADHKSAWVALGTTSFTTAAAEPTALVTWQMKVDQAAWALKSGTTEDGTNITSIASTADEPGSTSTGITGTTGKVVMASGESNVDKAASFTFTVNSAKKVVPEKVTCKVLNVSSGNRTYKAQLSDNNGHVYYSTNTVSVTTENVLTDATFNFASSLVLTGNVTLKVYAWKTSGSPTQFRMGEYVKLFGEVDDYSCTALNLTRGGQENGTYTVGNYTGNPLTCTVNAGEPASYQWKQYTLGQGVGEAVNAVGSGSTTTSFTPNPASANTYFYACEVTDICGNTSTTPYTGTFVFNTAVTYSVTHSLTNVTATSGATGAGAATEGVAYNAVFAANTGYVLPSTITVTIGGSPATVGTGYTWNSSTGAFQVPAAQVTGDIVITIAGEEMEGDGCDELVHTEAATATTLNTTVGTATLSGSSSQTTNSKAIKLNSSGYIELSPKAGKSFAAGDSLIIVMWNQASSAKTTGYRIAGTDYTASMPSKVNTTFRRKLIAADIVSSKVKIERESDNGSNAYFVSAIIKHCEDLPSCTTPTLPTLSNQTVCPGSDIAAWNAEPTNIATITGASQDVAYSWKKKGSDTELAATASFDLGSSATEGMAGTYVVTVTVSKTGYISKSASAEVDLTVTPATETPSITASKAKVYATDEVIFTATCGSTGVTWNWYLCANADGTGAGSSLGTASTYTLTSAPAAGTYYYKAVATGDGTHSCGTAEYVYTLVVSAANSCDKEFWFAKEGDRPTGAAAATHITGCPSGSSSASYTASIDGTNYTLTGSTGQKTGNVTIVVPAGNTGTLYVVVQGSSSRTITLSKGGVQVDQQTPTNSVWGVYTVSDLDAGTYTLVSSGNISWGIIALKLCPTAACTDDTPTAAATNATVCAGGTITITATGYETGATFQWQKQNASTSVWEDIDGATSATYTVATAAAEHAGNYHIVATKNCARTSNTVTIAVPSVPDFGSTVPASVSVMQTIALSINTVEATDATKYKWYKSADPTWDAGDTEIGTNKELIKAYDSEAIGNPSYYIFCRAQNACGITTSTAIEVNVTAYVEEDCATKGNEDDAEFGFENTGCGSGNFPNTSTPCWNTNSKSKYLTYTAPDGKYFDNAKVTVAVSSDSKAAYGYSTDGSSYTYANLTGLSSALAEQTIDLPANVTHFRIGRNFDSGYGVTSGTFYLSKACFEYTDACTATTVTVSPTSKTYTIGNSWTAPTITLGPVAVASETLTYTSSDEDIATVDDDGTVNFQGRAGSVTITASYAGGEVGLTDYCASEGSYTITVSCSGDAPKIVEASTVDLSGCNSSVVLNAKEQDGTTDFTGGSYQWLRNGEEIDGATNKSYTATQAGIYTVEYTSAGGCTSVSTNSAVVTSETTEPEVERLVPFQYYHVDKTYTDQMKMRHLFAVKNSGTLDGKHFKMYVSRNGAAATDVTSSNALVVVPNGDGHVDTVMVDLNKLSGKYAKGDELVYTCKAIDCESHVSETYKSTIQMHVIDTDTATLALICSGSNKASGTRKTSELTVGGDFLTGYNVADLCQQTGNTSFDANTEWGLYTRLKENYIVTPVNGYAVFNKLNYEPFDILLLTDYPKASKSDAAKDVLDDMAALCDYRPMLSFKTHMVAKSPSKWAAKGFTTSATENKADGRLNLNIVCYAHPMFESIKEGENVYDDVANSSAPLVYTMLTDVGHEGKKGMQGFELAAAENFVTIGLTHYNATITKNSPNAGEVSWTPGTEDRMLVTVAERQTNIEARFILFSLNCGAQSMLTEKGRTVILKCLEYLLETDPLKVADCSFTFDNGDGNKRTPEQQAINCSSCPPAGDGKWSNPANWGPDYRLLPGEFTSVRIKKPVEVDMEHAHVMEVRIIDEGSIDIPAGKALDVKSTIRRMDGTEIYPTEESDIHIGSASTGNGTLIFNNNDGDTKARVDMYSNAKADIANMSAATSTWQYIGTPHKDVASATRNYYDSWLYQYGSGTWEVIPNGGPLVPFRGYCVTHPDAPVVFSMEGTLAATTTQDIAIPAGYTVIANSWVAPIDINAITDDDMEGITDKTIYFFNTGTDAGGTAGTGTAAGTYRATPIHSSSYTGDWQIPSMQGFYVSTTSAGTLHLDYDRHVRPIGSRSVVSNPMYAPRRAAAESDEPNVLKIFARGSRYQDKLVVLEREDFTRGYDSGWDGEAWGGSNLSPMVYVTGEGREDAVSAIPEFEGTVIAFKAGEDNEYTIDFEYNSEEPLYLLDTENNTYTQIMTGNAYYFTTSDKSKHARFILTRKSPQITTGVGNVSGDEVQGTKAKKLLIEDKMFIMVNGMLYDATGKVVK